MWEAPISPWAAAPPPGQERHEEYYPGISTSLIGVGLFSTILAVAVVCLRLYSRIFSARGLRADDCESRFHARGAKSQMALLLTNDRYLDLIILATGFLIGFFAICVRRQSLQTPCLRLGNQVHTLTVTVYGVGTHVWDVYMANYTPGILQVRSSTT